MPLNNKKIAEKLEEVAGLLELKGENRFRVRSYRDAARVISGMSEDLGGLVDSDGKLQDIPGIGESIAEKIKEIIKTGKLKQLEKLKKEIPESLLEVMALEQMGPQRTKVLYEKLGVETIEDLKKAAEGGKIDDISGFGKKMSETILKAIEEYEESDHVGRFKLKEVEDRIESLREYLKEELDNISIAGSYRRKKETVGDIDILATSKNPKKGVDRFTSYEDVSRVLSKGDTKSSLFLKSGMRVDLRVIEKRSYGSAMLYFTGSKAHNIELRKIAQDKNMKVNEYGLFKGKKRIASKKEEDIYDKLGLKYVEPELRENKGEIEAARNNKLPTLIKLEDIRGDLQTHTKYSDGIYSIEDMVKAAEEMGYEYYAITDHSKRVTMAGGLDEKKLAEQIEKIDELNKKMKKLRILKAIEVDILEDGSLDLSDDILKELDIVICAIHYNQNLSEKKQTRRVLKAMENPYFNILAHPTGRLIGKRKGYEIDLKKVMKEAKDKGCYLEINAAPERLDLNDDNARMAKEMNLKISISTDAHSIDQLKNMEYGVNQARRGWLEKDDVLNTRPWKELKKLLKRN
ncbi:MAG: DNA polymerase/3'-5' exonuclease PolX [Bacteroidota bacterium]